MGGGGRGGKGVMGGGGEEDCIYIMTFVCMVVWGDDMSQWSGLGWRGVMTCHTGVG